VYFSGDQVVQVFGCGGKHEGEPIDDGVGRSGDGDGGVGGRGLKGRARSA
jgi:hypothetical protein